MTAATWVWTDGQPAGRPERAGDVRRQALWDHCRNSLGIARLLLREGRPPALVSTACHMAVEMACRAALTLGGEPAQVAEAQVVLPADLRLRETLVAGAERLAAAERAVAWVADYLRSAAPERSWGF
jgi:hypothetical protein